jgi:hypothetical protein
MAGSLQMARWVAYCSDENRAGDFEVVVSYFPPSSKWQVSSNGGYWPVWSDDGNVLGGANADFSVFPGEQKSLLNQLVSTGESPPITVVANWTSELKKR